MGVVLSFISGFVAPVFIIISPITSYADQIASIHKKKSSAGFSLDIPLIMLVSCTLRVFYYPGAKYDASLLIQAMIMLVVQTLLLYVALENRPGHSSKGGEMATPFAGVHESDSRPYNFWKWRSSKPYWQFLLYMFIILTTCELLFAPFAGLYSSYSAFIGYLGLAIEATLPLPQILINKKARSCKGFRLSVLVSWLAGDFMKLLWFFTATTEIPWSFKLCGMFQACCDSYLGIQYLMYGSGESVPVHTGVSHIGHSNSLHPGGGIARPRTPSGAVRIPMAEKDERLD